MEYKMRDFITREELTEENFIRCLNGYLDTINKFDKDETEDLLLYLDSALQLGGADLAGAAIDCIRVDLLGR